MKTNEKIEELKEWILGNIELELEMRTDFDDYHDRYNKYLDDEGKKNSVKAAGNFLIIHVLDYYDNSGGIGSYAAQFEDDFESNIDFIKDNGAEILSKLEKSIDVKNLMEYYGEILYNDTK